MRFRRGNGTYQDIFTSVTIDVPFYRKSRRKADFINLTLEDVPQVIVRSKIYINAAYVCTARRGSDKPINTQVNNPIPVDVTTRDTRAILA